MGSRITRPDPIHPWLATMAAAELATREARYPARVEQGKMSKDAAEADIAAWRAIAALFNSSPGMPGEGDQAQPGGGAGAGVETTLSWGEIAHAARLQFDALARPTGGAMPADAAKAERLGAVEAILSRLEGHREAAMARPTEQGRAAA